MDFQLVLAFSLSIWIAAFLSIARIQYINRENYPFIIVVWLAALNETLTYILYRNGLPNIINTNVYSLLESIILLWFLHNLGAFGKFRVLKWVLICIFILAWIWDNFYLHKFGTEFNSNFMIVYALPVVILSINAINQMVMKEKQLARNPGFVICTGIVIFYTFNVVVEVFYIYGLKLGDYVTARIYDILTCVNLLCNLIYAYAILWMRKKRPYTLQY